MRTGNWWARGGGVRCGTAPAAGAGCTCMGPTSGTPTKWRTAKGSRSAATCARLAGSPFRIHRVSFARIAVCWCGSRSGRRCCGPWGIAAVPGQAPGAVAGHRPPLCKGLAGPGTAGTDPLRPVAAGNPSRLLAAASPGAPAGSGPAGAGAHLGPCGLGQTGGGDAGSRFGTTGCAELVGREPGAARVSPLALVSRDGRWLGAPVGAGVRHSA